MSERGFARKLWALTARKSAAQAGAALAWHAAVAWRGVLRRGGILADGPWAREVMDRETGTLVDRLDPPRLHALEISGDKWGRLRRFASYRSAGLPSFDVCRDVLPERFDLVIAEQVWEMNLDSDTNYVEVAVRRLRAKLDDPFTQKLLHTVRGMGYVLEDRS